jgi:hypothetical protein
VKVYNNVARGYSNHFKIHSFYYFANMSLFSKSKRFDDSLNTAVFTTVHVVNEHSPILAVYHDEDGAWQFIGEDTDEDYEEIARIVGLGQIIKIDKSVLELADLPLGYHAVRDSRKDEWVIGKTEYSDE